MRKWLNVVSTIILVFGSLIVFPAYLHWMVLVWIGLALVMFSKQQPIWPWLIGSAIILAIKRPGFTVEFWVLVLLLGAVAFVDWKTRRLDSSPLNKKRLITIAVVLILTTANYGIVRWFAVNTSEQRKLDKRPIACLGDSLTDFGYPQELEKILSVPIADFGVNGITTDDGIKMVPDILAVDPQLVVIELGGHDYNGDHKPRSATRANLEALVTAFLDRNVAVVLVEIPRGFVSDPYDGLERELAAKYDLQLIDDSVIRSFIFNGPILPPGIWIDPSRRYSNDGLHPNKFGNRYFARVVSQALVKVYGDSVLK